MALGTTDSSITLWDLRPLELTKLLENPLSSSTPNHLAALILLTQTASLATKVKNTLFYLERLLKHRFRFDIEVSAMQQIKAGEFDIEIE